MSNVPVWIFSRCHDKLKMFLTIKKTVKHMVKYINFNNLQPKIEVLTFIFKRWYALNPRQYTGYTQLVKH